jgi:aminoglycoside phosphotransferase (APT) family kinase protein
MMVDNNKDTQVIQDKLLAYLREMLGKPDLEYSASLVPLQGGYETAIYRFQLAGAPAGLSQPLVLRLYPAFYGTGNARWEYAIQNVMVEVGYPAAKAHLLCSDMEVLGGAFFIMDHIPGQPLLFAPPEKVMVILGQSHASLHLIDPNPVVAALKAGGLDQYVYDLGITPESIERAAVKMPWLREGLEWLLEHRPPEPTRLSVCHGDFHPINIMVQDGQVSGVLDWAGFRIADPAFDVANTIVLTSIAAKNLSATWEGLPPIDWELATKIYLAEYEKLAPLDHTHLETFQVRRCLRSLIEGHEGQQVWQYPPIVQDVLAYIRKITGIEIVLPD